MVDKTYKIRQDFLMDNKPDNEEFFESNLIRKEIRKIIEERIKSGSGYYNSKLNNKYGLKATRYMKKKRDRDPLGEYYRRHKGGKKAYKKNKWIKFVKEYGEMNPNLTGRKLLKEAGKEYRKIKNN